MDMIKLKKYIDHRNRFGHFGLTSNLWNTFMKCGIKDRLKMTFLEYVFYKPHKSRNFYPIISKLGKYVKLDW